MNTLARRVRDVVSIGYRKLGLTAALLVVLGGSRRSVSRWLPASSTIGSAS